ncbi:MAG: conjugal transfer pilus assembly protein TraU [Candidatus Porifericomitaceae bacterium WSBS_2022_MAG_OTU9]
MRFCAATLLLFLLMPPAVAKQPCHGKFPNPVTDICWRCIFPIRIGPVRISFGQEDSGDSPPLVCVCPGTGTPPIPRIGLGVTFWEPAVVVEVVRTPFCSPLLGGVQLADIGVAGTADHNDGYAFYHVHWYSYPLLSWLGLLTNLACGQAQQFDLAYATELDPLWQDDELAFLLSPDAVLFANPVAQAACAADCIAASTGFPLDRMFWCGGCQGSIYPLSGSTANHTGGVDSSLLLTQRLTAKLHRLGLAKDSSTRGAMCRPRLQHIMRKGQYKTQIVYPVPLPQQAHPFGRLSQPWAAGREYPVQGEDWAYVIFQRRLCCVSP